MKASDLVTVWPAPDNSRLTSKQFSFRLPVHVAAKLATLEEMYATKLRTQLVGELLAAATFLISITGGPDVYKGKDWLSAHKGMNIARSEFMAVLDDALDALKKNGVGRREQEDVLFALYSMRSQIVPV